MKSVEEIEALIARAREAGLNGLGILESFTLEEIQAAYNGIGPEWAGANARDWVTAHLDLFAPAALIHDLRYTRSDGSVNMFDFANWEFLTNCRRLADHAYPWYSWRRYRARLVADALHDFVAGPGGWAAWREAADKNLPARASAHQHPANAAEETQSSFP